MLTLGRHSHRQVAQQSTPSSVPYKHVLLATQHLCIAPMSPKTVQPPPLGSALINLFKHYVKNCELQVLSGVFQEPPLNPFNLA